MTQEDRVYHRHEVVQHWPSTPQGHGLFGHGQAPLFADGDGQLLWTGFRYYTNPYDSSDKGSWVPTSLRTGAFPSIAYKCDYCDGVVQPTIIKVHRPVPPGARDLGLTDQIRGALCVQCGRPFWVNRRQATENWADVYWEPYGPLEPMLTACSSCGLPLSAGDACCALCMQYGGAPHPTAERYYHQACLPSQLTDVPPGLERSIPPRRGSGCLSIFLLSPLVLPILLALACRIHQK